MLLALVVFTTIATAARADDRSAVDAERNEHAQHAVDDLKVRLQTIEQVAANLTPAERLMLLSGILCDAQDQAERAHNEIKKEQETILQRQQTRITYARQQLGRVKPTSCETPEAKAVVSCIRALGLVRAADAGCHVRASGSISEHCSTSTRNGAT